MIVTPMAVGGPTTHLVLRHSTGAGVQYSVKPHHLGGFTQA
jgi:hypothetical protein